MNKRTLVQEAAKECGLTQVKVKLVVDTFIKVMKETLEAGNEVGINNFGSWKLVDRKARKGVNPRTQEPIQIPAKTVVRFRAGKELKTVVNV